MSEFEALYTKHKTQKRKIWHDGLLRVSNSTSKATLIDEAGNVLETLYSVRQRVEEDAELEFVGYLVQVGAAKAHSSPAAAAEKPIAPATQPPLHPNTMRRIPLQHGSSSEAVAQGGAASSGSPADPPARRARVLGLPRKRARRSTDDVLGMIFGVGQCAEATRPSPMPLCSNTAVAVEKWQGDEGRASTPTTEGIAIRAPSDTRGADVRVLNASTPTAPAIPQKPPSALQALKHARTVAVLRYPSSQSLASSSKLAERSVTIPDSFPSGTVYENTMAAALVEELNLRIVEAARALVHHAPQAPSRENLQSLRRRGVNLYVSSMLFVSRKYDDWEKAQAMRFARRRKRGSSSDSDGEDSGAARTVKYFLQVPNHEKERASSYSKDDLWIVSKCFPFAPTDTVFFRGAWHGLSSKSMMQLLPADGTESNLAAEGRTAAAAAAAVFRSVSWKSPQQVYALRVGEVASEFSMLECVRSGLGQRLPLLPALVGSGAASRDVSAFACRTHGEDAFQLRHLSRDDLNKILSRVCVLFSVNDDQREVMRRVVAWFRASGEPPQAGHSHRDSVMLVHGVFGAGKSTLLVAIIRLLSQIWDEDGNDSGRLLVSSLTNVAVDNILLRLLASGYDQFARVGSIRKIAKAILPQAVRGQGKDADSDTEKALREMAADASLSTADRSCVQAALREFLVHKASRSREALLKSYRVVGVTCAASSFPVMNGADFPLVVLDEASQMSEPSSLLPLARAGASRAILVGDPLQLPPTLGVQCRNDEEGLGRALFARLAQNGTPVSMLRTQYRCHPKICTLSNLLFYERRLRCGVSADDRHALLEGLGPLVFVDVANGAEERSRGGASVTNPAEARFVAQLAQRFVQAGIEESQIGIIALYKAQVALLRSLLGQDRSHGLGGAPLPGDSQSCRIQVSTVDAFQGAERDIIILACVRTEGVGFTVSPNRLNVAITRAKNHLLVCGHRRNLQAHPTWGSVLRFISAHGTIAGAHDVAAWARTARISAPSSSQSDDLASDSPCAHGSTIAKSDAVECKDQYADLGRSEHAVDAVDGQAGSDNAIHAPAEDASSDASTARAPVPNALDLAPIDTGGNVRSHSTFDDHDSQCATANRVTFVKVAPEMEAGAGHVAAQRDAAPEQGHSKDTLFTRDRGKMEIACERTLHSSSSSVGNTGRSTLPSACAAANPQARAAATLLASLGDSDSDSDGADASEGGSANRTASAFEDLLALGQPDK